MAERAITIEVNGHSKTLLVEPRTHLADALREHLNLTGTHLGCEQGVCGACTVLIDGIPQRSCIAYAVDCEGSRITTIEGLQTDTTMTILREAFSTHHALQCGFCTPGMLITARDIVLRLGEIPEARIREELAGNLCRCTGYIGIVDAVRSASSGRAPQPAQPATTTITPRIASGPPTAAAAPPVHVPAPTAHNNATSLEERVSLTASPDAVWTALGDLRQVAACLPGASIDTLDGDHLTGRVTMALGPVKVNFAGEATVTLDSAKRSGRLIGRGRDANSRAEGEIGWQVVPATQGSDILVQLSWRLTGPLAQFSRGALVQDVARRLARDFARNLDAVVAGQTPPVVRPPGLFALLWAVLKARFLGR